MTQHTAITEVERAACALLTKYLDKVTSPKVHEFATQVVSNPDFTERLPTGHHPNADSQDRKAADAFDYDLLPEERYSYCLQIDEAVANLGNSIVHYRDRGRPTGDQTVRLAEGLAVTTSLAAAIVEFNETVVNAYGSLVYENPRSA